MRDYLIGEELKKRGVNPIYLTYSKEAHNFYAKKRISCTYLPDELNKYKLTKEQVKISLEKFEKEYSIPSMNMILSWDVNHQQIKREKALLSLAQHFYFWKNLLENNEIDFIIGGIERYVNTVPFYVSKNYKTKYFCRGITPLIEGNFVLNNEIFGYMDDLTQYWEKNKERQLTDDEKSSAKDYINTVIVKKKGSYVGFAGESTINRENAQYFAKRLYQNLFIEKLKNPYAQVIRISKKELNKAVRKNFEKFYYDTPKQTDKYFYYPLHIENDAQLIVRAPHFSNQYFLIEYLSKCIPFGYKLYVKSHPNNVGGMQIKQLKKLKKLSNVVLIPPKTNSHDIIQNCSGIIAINSTVGLEGILHKKPVINLGKVFYDISGLTWKVKDLYELPVIIKKALEKNIVDDKKLLRFINAYLTIIRKGHTLFYKKTMHQATPEENISRVADGIMQKFKEVSQ